MDHIAYEQPYMSGACVSTLDSITNDLARGGSFWLSLNNQSNLKNKKNDSSNSYTKYFK